MLTFRRAMLDVWLPILVGLLKKLGNVKDRKMALMRVKNAIRIVLGGVLQIVSGQL